MNHYRCSMDRSDRAKADDRRPALNRRDLAGWEATGPGHALLGPFSPVWAAGPSLAGLVLAVPAAAEAFGTAPEARTPGYLVPLLLALALLAGGYSLLRLMQLAVMASRWDVSRQGGIPSRRVMSEHSMHGTWVTGVGGSLLLMGALGVWSDLDGKLSGLEPGTTLVAVGAAGSIAALALANWIGRAWEGNTQRHERVQKEERERRLADPLVRIREASRDSHPGSDPSS